VADLCNWDKICATIAATPPWWEPGLKTGYHAYTFGYIVGEIVRRATGKPISQVLREEVAGPLGVPEEIYFGVPEAQLGRLARLKDAPGSDEWMASMPDDSPFFVTAPKGIFPTAEFGNRADAVARMYAAILGEVDGVRLISPERLREVSAVAFEGDDQTYGGQAMWGLGYSIGRPGAKAEETTSWFGMVGAGGSCAYADTATGVSFAVAKNLQTFNMDAIETVARIVAETFAER
jgi:CubicO group peptidase (beta-lactamase class C family)